MLLGLPEKRWNVELPLLANRFVLWEISPFPGLWGDLWLLHLLEPSRSVGAREEQPEPSCCLHSQASQGRGCNLLLDVSGYICWKGAKVPGARQVKVMLVMGFRPETVDGAGENHSEE